MRSIVIFRFRRPYIGPVLLFLLALSVHAQNSSATIGGKVSDLNGRPVAGAPVQAKNADTAMVKTAQTNAAGIYTLAQVPAGIYEVSVGIPGFEQKVITVHAGDTAGADLHLIQEGIGLGTLGDGDISSQLALRNRPAPPSGPTPRSADGKADFSGVWAVRVADPGKPEMLPWAETVFKERKENYRKDSPNSFCLPEAILMPGGLWRLVQTNSILIVLKEGETPGYYQYFLDGRDHPKDAFPTWYGHSTGKWEGDTLVVETVAFNDRRWLSPDGEPHTEMLRMTERYRRPDFGHLEIETIVDDPGAFAKPWMTKRLAQLARGQEVMEYICNENNKDPQHMIGK